MFKKNHHHLQILLTSSVDELPEKLPKRLENSWAGVFYKEVYCKIDEAPFAVLYADCESRSNVAINKPVALGNWAKETLIYARCIICVNVSDVICRKQV